MRIQHDSAAEKRRLFSQRHALQLWLQHAHTCMAMSESSIRRLTAAGQGTARAAVLGTPELLEAILGALPFEPLYRARGVCKAWQVIIDHNLKLQRLMFLRPAIALRPPMFFYRELWTTPFQLNPLLARVLIVARKGTIAETGRWGMYNGHYTTWKNLRLFQNLLAREAVDNVSWPATGRPLVNASTRPIFTVDAASAWPVGNRILSRAQCSTEGQWNWQKQLICNPPIAVIGLRHGDTHATISRPEGVIMQDLLCALERLRREMGLRWPLSEDQIRSNGRPDCEFEITAPLQRRDGKYCVGGYESWRAMTRGLRCRLDQSPW